MAKKSNTKKFLGQVGLISIIIAVIFLVIYLITIITSSSAFYTASAETNAKIYFEKDMKNVSALVEQHYQNLYEIVDRVEYAKSKEEVDQVFASYIGSEQFGDLRYYSDGTSYSAYGEEIDRELSAHEMIMTISTSNTAACTEVYRDNSVLMDCIAFFVPVRGSAYVDGVLSIVPAEGIISVGEVIQESTSMVAVVGAKGKIYSRIFAENFTNDVGANVYDFLDKFVDNKAMSDEVGKLLLSDELATTEITTAQGVAYTVVAEPINAFDGHLHLLTISESGALITDEVDYIRHIVVVLLFAIVAFVVGFVFALLFRKKTNEEQAIISLEEEAVGCANAEGFKKAATALARTHVGRYAICACTIRRFNTLEEKLGADASIQLLKHMSQVLTTFSKTNETYGYAGDGKFLIYVDYAGESSVRDKLMIVETITNKLSLLVENKIKIKTATGVCVSDANKNRSISKMIDCAVIASEEAKNNPEMPYAIYTEDAKVKQTRSIQAKPKASRSEQQIEAQMENALQNNEFRLFMQPKYNMEKDALDSAEALVRWFDNQKGDYIYPAEFIGLFESNGFIAKLDHYIYLEVLKYISEAREHGDKIVPISVNVSHVTACRDDFINFYVGNKNKYLIDDGLITLEFSETFAANDFQKLIDVVNKLHEGGIRCSIDNFGSGYSSLRILKELPIDELKIDRMFLATGTDAARDDKIVSSMIALADDMGIHIVQVGVENKAMFDRVAKTGVEVVQGYYYAKAISLEEFKIFVKSNTSIRYKSIVK